MARDLVLNRHNELRRMREDYVRDGREQDLLEFTNRLFEEEHNTGRFRLRGIFGAMVENGEEWIREYCHPETQGGFRVTEATDAVNTGLFSNVMGQWLYNSVLDSYKMPELIGDLLVPTVSSIEKFERIPGTIALGDDSELVDEGQPYPNVVTAERWIETPETQKRGAMMAVTKEALFFDKTNQILERAKGVGRTIAINRERRILDCVTGITTTYKKNGAAAAATYGSENTKSTNPLVDWSSIDAAWILFSQMVDPDTGDPIVVTPDTLLIPPGLTMTANRIVNATMTGYNTNNSLGTADRETRVDGNSLRSSFRVLSNQYVPERTSSQTTWFYGNPRETFVYMQNWPLTVESEGKDGPEGFGRDIVARFKASERGVCGVRERLYNMKCTA